MKKFRRFVRMTWLTRIWYKITQFFTRDINTPVVVYNKIGDIAPALGWGNLWRPDPFKGKLDVQYHPTYVQKWIQLGNPKHMDCIPKGTLLLRGDGHLVPIEDIQVGDTVHDGQKYVLVARTFEPKTKPVLSFSLNNGCKLRLSPDHKVFLHTGEAVRAGHLKVRDRLLQPGDMFEGGSDHLSEDDALLLSAYITEGWKAHGTWVGIAGIPDSKGIREEIISAAVRNNWKYSETQNKQISICLPDDHEVWKTIPEMGERAKGKKFLHVNYDDHTVSKLVEVLIRTDGTFGGRAKRTPIFSTISDTLALQFRLLCRRLGLSTHMRLWHDHGGLGKNPIWRVTVRSSNKRVAAIVDAVTEESETTCYDLTTETGRIYLPEADVIVHNCDDHAAYWAAAIKKGNLAADVWLGFIYMKHKDTGKTSGHCVVLFKDLGRYFWADYREPMMYGLAPENKWDWVPQVAQEFNAEPLSAAFLHVRGLTKYDGLKFGKREYKYY